MKDADEKKAFSILIVDDEPNNIQLLGNLLQERGYEVEFATSGEEALEWIDSEEFDLILLDIVMPGIDGFEVCKKVKASPDKNDIPVIFLTGRTQSENIVKGFELGAVDYVVKPFKPIELMARVNTHLELKYNRDILKTMALMDGLTKLYNHAHIHERLSEEISRARRRDDPLSIIMLDLDRFKSINDVHGHKSGDRVLSGVAGLIKENIRKEDFAGRYGGEEFMIILTDTERRDAYIVAEKIRTKIQEKEWKGMELMVTISGGVCAFDNETGDDLIGKADRLLYKAKNKGGNRIEAG